MVDVRGASIACQWLYIASAVLSLCWFSRQRSLGRCKWEPIYVSFFGGLVSAIKVCFDSDEDATFVTFNVRQNGRSVPWLRFLGWFITLPVLLIHLSNLPGEANLNFLRTMRMMGGVQIFIAAIASATIMDSAWTWIFFFVGVCACGMLFYEARGAPRHLF